MENEENRGLIDKQASHDQWERLDQFNFGPLSLFSLSLYHSWTLRVSWSTFALEQEGKRR